jgi:GNAT superfamily N-acetyltransferase
MTLHVRPSRPEDAAAACQVVRDAIEQCCAEDHEGSPTRLAAWLRNKTPDNFLAWIERDDLFGVVAEDETGVVGFGMVSVEGELLLCYVAPLVLHQGAGKAMLQAMEQWATTIGLTGLRLESTQTALAFYGRHGFVTSGPSVSFAGMTSQPMRKHFPDTTRTS